MACVGRPSLSLGGPRRFTEADPGLSLASVSLLREGTCWQKDVPGESQSLRGAHGSAA